MALDSLSGSGETAVYGRSAAQGCWTLPLQSTAMCPAGLRTVRGWHTGLNACEHTVWQFAANRAAVRVEWFVDNCVVCTFR